MPASQAPDAPASAWLIPLAGPALPPIELKPTPSGNPLTLGRHEQCELQLPIDADKVSRVHATFRADTNFTPTRWSIADLKSRWGTFLNGYRLHPGPDTPLNEGDLIRITPWTFSFSYSPQRRGLQSQNDAATMQTMVRSVSPAPVSQRPMAEEMLTLLLECASALHSAPNEQALGEHILDAAVRGTGLQNAALLRPVDNTGRIEIIASRRAPGQEDAPLFSRSLLAAASTGVVAELSGGTAGESTSESIMQMRINAALCVPLMLGGPSPAPHAAPTPIPNAPQATPATPSADPGTVAAFLYLDARAPRALSHFAPSTAHFYDLRPGASAFCVALGRIASLALANLKRMDIEHRQALMEAELSAAATAQKWILPRTQTELGSFKAMGTSRPGQYVGGDFFDIIPLPNNRLAIAVGDVTGKGVAASVLMTAAQGFLHAALHEHDPAKAVTDLNRFINPRRPESKFITLWVGVIDIEKMTLSYVDAGHSYAALSPTANPGDISQLSDGDNLPIGLTADGIYTSATVPLPAAGRVVVVSDGIIEQPAPLTVSIDRQEFEMAGVFNTLRTLPPGQDIVAALFKAVFKHAQSEALADDATAVVVRW